MTEEKEFRRDFCSETLERSACDNIVIEIVNYRGTSTKPKWMDSEHGTSFGDSYSCM